MKRKRMLQIVGDSEFGGGSIMIIEIARQAAKEGFDVNILTTNRTMIERAIANNIGVVNIDVIRRDIRPMWDLAGLIRLYFFLLANRYDIVHTHTSKAGFVGRLAAYMARVPKIIHTVHGFAFHEGSSRASLLAYSFLEKLAGLLCHYIVFVSYFHAGWALRLGIGSKSKNIVIQNGIDEGRMRTVRKRDDIAREFRIPADTLWMVTTGRLAKQKGLSYLLQAALIMKEKADDFQIIIVGDGPLKDDLKGYSESNGLSDCVTFVGFQEDVGSFVGSADIIALPSLWEGLSIALLEAMALSKPILTTTIGSNLEVLEDNVSGIMAPPKDPEALAEKLLLLLFDANLRSKLGKNAYRRFKDRFTQERMILEYMELYRR